MKSNRQLIIWLLILAAAAVFVMGGAYYHRYTRAQSIKALGANCDALHVTGTVPVTLISIPSDSSIAWYPVDLAITDKAVIQRLCDLFGDQVMFHRVRRWDRNDSISSKSQLSFQFAKGGRQIGKLTIVASDVLLLSEDEFVESSDELLRVAIRQIGL